MHEHYLIADFNAVKTGVEVGYWELRMYSYGGVVLDVEVAVIADRMLVVGEAMKVEKHRCIVQVFVSGIGVSRWRSHIERVNASGAADQLRMKIVE